jgi:hypothetical protein
MNVLRAAVTGVSLPTLHSAIEARLRSRRMFSASMRRAVAKVSGSSQAMRQ